MISLGSALQKIMEDAEGKERGRKAILLFFMVLPHGTYMNKTSLEGERMDGGNDGNAFSPVIPQWFDKLG